MSTTDVVLELRRVLRKGDMCGFTTAVRRCGPQVLAAIWNRLTPLGRLAAYQSLHRSSAAKIFATLPMEDRWLIYLGEISRGTAPLFEGGVRQIRDFRRSSHSERMSLRRRLS